MTVREILIASALVFPAACQGGMGTAIGAEDLIGRSWVLESVDGDSVTDAKPRPDLAFAEELRISGVAGCNRFFGKATLEAGRLVTGPVGTTRMACPPPQEDLERKVLAVLTEGCEIGLEGDTLTLQGSDHILIYRRGEEPGQGDG